MKYRDVWQDIITLIALSLLYAYTSSYIHAAQHYMHIVWVICMQLELYAYNSINVTISCHRYALSEAGLKNKSVLFQN